MAFVGYVTAQAIFTKAVIDELAEIEGTEETEGVELGGHVDGPVSFDYPDNWHVFSGTITNMPTGATYVIAAHPSPIIQGSILGPSRVVTIWIYDRSKLDLGISSSYTDMSVKALQSPLNDISVEPITINGLDAWRIVGQVNDGIDTPYWMDSIIYETDQTVVVATFHNKDSVLGLQEQWDIILRSLDFSFIL